MHEQVAYTLLLGAANARANLLLGAGGLVRLAEVVDRYVGTVLGETNGDRLADARRAAGYEHVLALEPKYAFPGGRVGDCVWHGHPPPGFRSSGQRPHADCVSRRTPGVTAPPRSSSWAKAKVESERVICSRARTCQPNRLAGRRRRGELCREPAVEL